MQWEDQTASNDSSSTTARMSEIDPTKSGALRASMSMRTSFQIDWSNAGCMKPATGPDPALRIRLGRPRPIDLPFLCALFRLFCQHLRRRPRYDSKFKSKDLARERLSQFQSQKNCLLSVQKG